MVLVPRERERLWDCAWRGARARQSSQATAVVTFIIIKKLNILLY